MKKTTIAIIAITDGMLLVLALLGVVLGLIHSISTSPEFAFLMIAPLPVVWVHIKLQRLCDKLYERIGKSNDKKRRGSAKGGK